MGVPPALAASCALTPLGASGRLIVGAVGAVASTVQLLIAGSLLKPLMPERMVVLLW